MDNLIINTISKEMNLKDWQVKAVIELLDNDNTIPFIARYRKEKTGELDEVVLRNIHERLTYLRNLEKRKEEIIESIAKQDKLTDELKEKILNCTILQELEDLYLPYRPKKRTKAKIAIEKGLEPLALMMIEQKIESGNLEDYAKDYINPELELFTIEDVYKWANYIVAEHISDNSEIRKIIREFVQNEGYIDSSAKDEQVKSEYEMYYKFNAKISSLVPHRILAINRGEREEILNVKIIANEDIALKLIEKEFITNYNTIFLNYLILAIKDAYNRLIFPAIEREIRSSLTEKAEEHAVNVFAVNLRNLLLQPPISQKIIMGIDPGYRTGCKVAVIDKTGKFCEGATIYPHEPHNKKEEAKKIISDLIDKYNVDVIAIGNGTASRETEFLVAELNESRERKIEYIIVSEAGASVYSASEIAREEFPDLEASLRGNISIARRLLDPLAELVKIDPKSIGVGLYQHDVNQKYLEEKLSGVVESCVNYVGVDLNTASYALLSYISGINKRLAKKIVSYRESVGKFTNREELKNVSGLGSKVFEQCAGFLRIIDGTEELDNTNIHPESYEATRKFIRFIFEDENLDIKTVLNTEKLRKKLNQINKDLPTIAEKLSIGLPTLKDIVENLKKPGRDPRNDLPKPIFRSDVLKIEDLKEGMILKGTIRNVVDFGAFVDIGLKRDGLIHISELADKFVKNPLDVVEVGDIVDVKVVSVDIEKGRVNLSMRLNS